MWSEWIQKCNYQQKNEHCIKNLNSRAKYYNILKNNSPNYASLVRKCKKWSNLKIREGSKNEKLKDQETDRQREREHFDSGKNQKKGTVT